MPALDHVPKCPECNKTHEVYLAIADMFDANAKYRYVCPETQGVVQYTPSIVFKKAVSHRPPGAVIVQLVQ